MKLKYSVRADRDLEDIGDWIAADNPVRAITFVEELRDACRKLLDFPRAFPPSSASRSLHRKLHRHYIIYYRVNRDRVFIIRIVHGARDQSRLL